MIQRILFTAAVLSVLSLSASFATEAAAPEVGVAAVLDDFHLAAAEADEERYFGHMAEGSVFIGTDAGETWSKEEFRGYAHPVFARGQGWTYTATDRHIYLSRDGSTAWFDEMLSNAKYGDCRGTGVLQLYDGVWKIEQYHLTIPIPNELSLEVVGRIRELSESGADD